jgi:hypothetical protein
MSESRTLTLDDLTNLFDDVDPSETMADEVPENTGTPTLAPIPSGKYGVKLIAFDVDRDMNGDVRNKKNFSTDVKIVDPEKFEGRSVRFLKVSGETRKRKNKGVEYKYTELFDLCKGFDADFVANGSLDVAARFLIERIADGSIVYVQLDWKAWDGKHFDAMNGSTLQDGSEEKKALFKACSFKGQRHFQADGTLLAPSGNLLKARPYIRWTYEAARATV